MTCDEQVSSLRTELACNTSFLREVEGERDTLRWLVKDLEHENEKLQRAIRDIIDCWDHDYMSRMKQALNAAEDLL